MDPNDRDQFDDLLDGALKQYGSVEPRAGLEGRVLASLSANVSGNRARGLLGWALAGAATMIVIIGIWTATGHRRPETVAVVQPNVSGAPAQKSVIAPAELIKPAARRVRSRQTTATTAKGFEPRLQQFPSRRPITRQELVVAQYVQHFAGEAALVAKEQQEFDEQIRAAQQQIRTTEISNE